jgi:hypothetical protein
MSSFYSIFIYAHVLSDVGLTTLQASLFAGMHPGICRTLGTYFLIYLRIYQ